MKMAIYLAGPITGASYSEARFGWRNDLALKVKRYVPFDVELLSPMRNTEDHAGVKCLASPAKDEPNTMLTARGTMTRDFADIRRCDLFVCCLTEATRVSIGTMIELGYARAEGKPILMIYNGNPVHEHAWVQEIGDYNVTTIADAVKVIREHLGTGL